MKIAFLWCLKILRCFLVVEWENLSLFRRARQQFFCRCDAGTGVGGTEASWQFMGCLIASAELWEIRGWFRRVWLLGNVHWKWLKSKLRVPNVADPRSRAEAELQGFEMPKRGIFFVLNVNERSRKLMCLGVQILQRSKSFHTQKRDWGAFSRFDGLLIPDCQSQSISNFGLSEKSVVVMAKPYSIASLTKQIDFFRTWFVSFSHRCAINK